METVLVIGATGNIGVAAVIGALRAKRNVLAIVRNANSADKLFKHVGSREGITIAEADIMSETGVQSVIEKVKAGVLPAFEHVYSSAGGGYAQTALKDVSTDELRGMMALNFETNFFAYRATIKYLLEMKNPNSSWTLCTGSQGTIALRALPAMTQGALFSMATAAARENESTNIRFNEVYLGARVEVDESAAKTGAIKASDFALVYEQLIQRNDVRSCRVSVDNLKSIRDLQFERKF